MLINSWKGFFSIGSSFLGLVTGLTEVSISFFILTLETELLSELLLFVSLLITFSNLGVKNELSKFFINVFYVRK